MPERDLDIAILGAGLAGLSTSYHLGHPANAAILEAKDHYGGHVYSWERDGFTWDDGPHISITMNEYIKDLFAEFVDGEYEERPDQGGQLLPGSLARLPGADEPVPGARAAAHAVPRELPRDGRRPSTRRRRTTRSGCTRRWARCSPTTSRLPTPGSTGRASPGTSTSTGSGSESCDRRSTTSSTGAKGPLPKEHVLRRRPVAPLSVEGRLPVRTATRWRRAPTSATA